MGATTVERPEASGTATDAIGGEGGTTGAGALVAAAPAAFAPGTALTPAALAPAAALAPPSLALGG
jgi:hypothetical protein